MKCLSLTVGYFIFPEKEDVEWGANLRAKTSNETGKFKFIYYT